MPKTSKEALIKQLAENNLALQDKTAELIASIGKLVKRLDNMVDIFEEAAKNIKSQPGEPLIAKLNDLLEQNRNLARGLTLLERYVKGKGMAEFPPKPLPKTEF